MEQNNCPFCKIIRGEISADKIYEDEHVFAFLDNAPNNLGHSLVIPKEHFENIYTTPDTVLENLITATKKISIAIKKGVGAQGINIANNNESASGQVVFHIHIHIVPRYKDDGFKHWPGKSNYSPEETREAAGKIKKALEN